MSIDRVVVAVTQLNPIVGDLSGNMGKLIAAWREAARRDAQLLVTSELFVTGYQPEDFVLKPRIQKAVREAIEALARETASGPAILVGAPWVEDGRLYNAALLLDGGNVVARTMKYDLPNYGVFDEKRVFTPGGLPEALNWRGLKLGVMLCEDMWKPDCARRLKETDAEILIVLNGSPFETGKQNQRHELARLRVQETGLPLIYVNQVGGQDELVYEGASFAMNQMGEIRVQAKLWQEDVIYLPLAREGHVLVPEAGTISSVPNDIPMVYEAILTGLRDYVRKNNFERVILGLSGGIDSALAAVMAVDALGANNVFCLMMPSPYTSRESIQDATSLTETLGCHSATIPIEEGMKAFDHMLAEAFMGCQPDVTEENIQARLRGMLLMALANKSFSMVLATGNKSELATGYATLYGDMCGAYAPLKDVYKTDVYKLAEWRHKRKPALALGPNEYVFPTRVFTKAPSAELRPGQKDQDTLPPYDILDGILKSLLEQNLGVADTSMMGFDSATVTRVYSMLDASEYKRRQAAPGPKVTRHHLTRDRRYPMTNRYTDKWRTQEEKTDTPQKASNLHSRTQE